MFTFLIGVTIIFSSIILAELASRFEEKERESHAETNPVKGTPGQKQKEKQANDRIQPPCPARAQGANEANLRTRKEGLNMPIPEMEFTITFDDICQNNHKFHSMLHQLIDSREFSKANMESVNRLAAKFREEGTTLAEVVIFTAALIEFVVKQEAWFVKHLGKPGNPNPPC